MTPLELADACEKATADRQADLLSDAWDLIAPTFRHDELPEKARQFGRMIDAKAFESAAITLVPEGWNAQIGLIPTRSRYWVELAKPEHDPLLVGRYSGRCNTTLALAICAASLRAWGKM